MDSVTIYIPIWCPWSGKTYYWKSLFFNSQLLAYVSLENGIIKTIYNSEEKLTTCDNSRWDNINKFTVETLSEIFKHIRKRQETIYKENKDSPSNIYIDWMLIRKTTQIFQLLDVLIQFKWSINFQVVFIVFKGNRDTIQHNLNIRWILERNPSSTLIKYYQDYSDFIPQTLKYNDIDYTIIEKTVVESDLDINHIT